MLHGLEAAVLAEIDRLTRDTYSSTNGQEVTEFVKATGLMDGPTLDRVMARLREEGFITHLAGLGAGTLVLRNIELTTKGRSEIASVVDPFERIQTEARRTLASLGFRQAYPGVFEPWADAERLLWQNDATAQLTTIGHKIREATQAFATALVERQAPPDVEADKTKVEKRLGAVIAVLRPRLGEAHREVLEKLGDLWEANNKLVQRQEHGAQKEGNPVDWDDARRIVSLTMFLMIEFATIIESNPPPDPVAVLEGGGRLGSPIVRRAR